MRAKEKAVLPGQGQTAYQTSDANRIESKPHTQRLRLPAFGRDLMDLQRSGRNVVWLCLSLDWNFGRGMPRVVIPDDVEIEELDLRFVRGIDCLVVHYSKPARAFSIASLAHRLKAGRCPVFDLSTGKLATTSEVLTACQCGEAYEPV